MTEQERIQDANDIIDSYCKTLKQRLLDEISLYKRNNPGWEFSHVNFQFHESMSTYTLTPVFQKPKTDG